MNISQNSVVHFHYILKDENGEQLEDTANGDPVVYLHGHNNLLIGLENALEGKTSGENVSVTLPPDEAFGERRDDSEMEVPTEHLMGANDWQAGMLAVVNTNQGQRQIRVIAVDGDKATIDTNHPLAGQTLIFDMEVLEVREASEEELTHGHAHGPGGHQH
ncbi:MAG: peptidylprolyl isomerase [Pseudohongiellaceae bacterium]